MALAFMSAFVGCTASPIKDRYCNNGLFVTHLFILFHAAFLDMSLYGFSGYLEG